MVAIKWIIDAKAITYTYSVILRCARSFCVQEVGRLQRSHLTKFVELSVWQDQAVDWWFGALQPHQNQE